MFHYTLASKTKFATLIGQFELLRRRFGFVNAPSVQLDGLVTILRYFLYGSS